MTTKDEKAPTISPEEVERIKSQLEDGMLDGKLVNGVRQKGGHMNRRLSPRIRSFYAKLEIFLRCKLVQI